MKRLLCVLLLVSLPACGGNETTNNTTANNSNATNNDPNNGPSNASNMPNNQPNQTASNQPNNQTQNNTSNQTQNNTNQMTNSGNPLECAGDFGMMQACGGNPQGTWDVSQVCSDADFTTVVTDLCPDAVIEGSQQLEASGTLTVTATSFTREITGSVTFGVDLPQGCSFNDCGLAVGSLESVVEDAQCNDLGAEGCACTVTVALEEMNDGTYTVSGGTATLDTGESYHFCSRSQTMLLREVGGEFTTLYVQQ